MAVQCFTRMIQLSLYKICSINLFYSVIKMFFFLIYNSQMYVTHTHTPSSFGWVFKIGRCCVCVCDLFRRCCSWTFLVERLTCSLISFNNTFDDDDFVLADSGVSLALTHNKKKPKLFDQNDVLNGKATHCVYAYRIRINIKEAFKFSCPFHRMDWFFFLILFFLYSEHWNGPVLMLHILK